MEFSIIRLGQDVFFEGNQRTQVTEKEFNIEFCSAPQGYVLTHKKSLKRHFISIYNVAYAEIKESPVKEEEPEIKEENQEGLNVEPTTTASEDNEGQAPTGQAKRARKKKSDQN